MKQSLKYGLFLVLALLIHVVSNEAMEDNCRVSPPTYRQEKCYVSQDHPVHNALERLHYFYSTQSCDMSHADVAHIPTDKSVQLLITYFREYKSQQNTSQIHSLHIPKYFYDPITYYIYGLRKIVIQTVQSIILFVNSLQLVSSGCGETNCLFLYNIQSKQLLKL